MVACTSLVLRLHLPSLVPRPRGRREKWPGYEANIYPSQVLVVRRTKWGNPGDSPHMYLVRYVIMLLYYKTQKHCWGEPEQVHVW